MVNSLYMILMKYVITVFGELKWTKIYEIDMMSIEGMRSSK